jgi:hypothetical protein
MENFSFSIECMYIAKTYIYHYLNTGSISLPTIDQGLVLLVAEEY